MNLSPLALTLSIANFRSQALNDLVATAKNGKGHADHAVFPFQLPGSEADDPLAALTQAGDSTGLSSTGRNLALFDPESAYKMMTSINGKDITYKAQFAELSQMKDAVAKMQQAGESLSGIGADTANADIQTQLQGFVEQYNQWVQQFNPDMAKGGLLADTQAAQISRYELSQSIENRFNGARYGMHGLRDLGISIDPVSKLASLDAAKLNEVLGSNKQGAVDALQAFSMNFSKSASLLNAEGNFIPNQLKNLHNAIHYIGDNKHDWQAEFGMGDAAKPSGQVAQALAAYNKVYAI